MKITIDGRAIEADPSDRNLVDVADRAGIGIPAACYRAKQSKGCCHACVVEIGEEQKFACATAPEDGMVIVLNRPDLKALRKERLLKYQEGIKSGTPCKCSGSSNCCE